MVLRGVRMKLRRCGVWIDIYEERGHDFHWPSYLAHGVIFRPSLYQFHDWLGSEEIRQHSNNCIIHFSAIFPELRPAILPKEPIADKPLKLLLPSLKFDFLDLLGFVVGLDSNSSSLLVLILATVSSLIAPRQKGHAGPEGQAAPTSSFLWQHNARVQWAHIWWPHGLTSIVHTWSKHIQHNSTLLLA